MFMRLIEVPKEVKVEVSGGAITVQGPLGRNSRQVNTALLSVAKTDKGVSVEHTNEKKLARKAAMAEVALAKAIRNDIDGVTRHFEKKMRVVFAHFPVTVEAKGNVARISNLIGERFPRQAAIVGDTKMEVKGQAVRVYGTSKDDVGQTAANIRKACRIRRKDERVFQDGVYHELEV